MCNQKAADISRGNFLRISLSASTVECIIIATRSVHKERRDYVSKMLLFHDTVRLRIKSVN